MIQEFKHNVEMHDKIYKIYNIKHSEIFNEYEQSRIKGEIKDIIKSIKNRNIKVLDFGAGTGNLTLKFLEQGCEVFAADVSMKSLDFLKELSENNQMLKLKLLEDKKLPFKDNTFDITSSYSLLHHIPDYLFAVEEMIRVTKPGGYIYMDHEGDRESTIKCSKEYSNLTKETKGQYIRKMFLTREIFSYEFIKAAFIKTFINKRYQREGDIHVWEDDYIEWSKIKKILKKNNCEIIKDESYLTYNPKLSMDQHNYFKNKYSNNRMVVAIKINLKETGRIK